jgi:hypothetical protein
LVIRTKYVGTKVTTRLLADLMLPRNKIVIFCLNCFYDLLRFLKNILIINKIIKKFFFTFFLPRTRWTRGCLVISWRLLHRHYIYPFKRPTYRPVIFEARDTKWNGWLCTNDLHAQTNFLKQYLKRHFFAKPLVIVNVLYLSWPLEDVTWGQGSKTIDLRLFHVKKYILFQAELEDRERKRTFTNHRCLEMVKQKQCCPVIQRHKCLSIY